MPYQFPVVLALFLVVCAFAIALVVQGCSTMNKAEAEGVVRKMGFTNPECVEEIDFVVAWDGCSKGDDRAFKVWATNAQGQRVQLLVCTGLWKAATVRVL